MQLNVVKLRSVAAFNAYKLIVRTSVEVPDFSPKLRNSKEKRRRRYGAPFPAGGRQALISVGHIVSPRSGIGGTKVNSISAP
jgi:hypothetical protein